MPGTEFVGTTVLDTVGIVISSVDEALARQMKISGVDTPYRTFGLLSSRTGAAGQIVAVDEAVKNSSCSLVSLELPRDTKGWGGHGNYIVIGSNSLDDARLAVKMALELTEKNAGEVYINEAGHLECAYSPAAGEVINKAFGTPVGKAFGFVAASPAAIGMLAVDKALKVAPVEITKYMSPSFGTSHSNEIIAAFTGDASSVKEAVLVGRAAALDILRKMGSEPTGPSVPFLK